MKYHPDEKAAIMVLLECNGGDVQITAQQTGVTDRTLYRWQRQILAQLRRYTPPSTQLAGTLSAGLPVFDNDLDRLAFIRGQIMEEITRLTANFGQPVSSHTAYQRVLILSQLIDKLMKLDLHLKPYKPQEPVEIVISGHIEEDDTVDWEDYAFNPYLYRDEHNNIIDSRDYEPRTTSD